MNHRRIGNTAMFLSLVLFIFIAGSIDSIPPEAGLKEWLTLIGATFTALCLGFLGLSFLDDQDQ